MKIAETNKKTQYKRTVFSFFILFPFAIMLLSATAFAYEYEEPALSAFHGFEYMTSNYMTWVGIVLIAYIVTFIILRKITRDYTVLVYLVFIAVTFIIGFFIENPGKSYVQYCIDHGLEATVYYWSVADCLTTLFFEIIPGVGFFLALAAFAFSYFLGNNPKAIENYYDFFYPDGDGFSWDRNYSAPKKAAILAISSTLALVLTMLIIALGAKTGDQGKRENYIKSQEHARAYLYSQTVAGSDESFEIDTGGYWDSDFPEDYNIPSAEYNCQLKSENREIPLSSFDRIQQGSYVDVGNSWTSKDTYTDVNGTAYDSNHLVFPLETGFSLASEIPGSEDDSAVTYYIFGQYSCLSGTVFRPYGTLYSGEWEKDAAVKIYGDGILLYEAAVTKSTWDPTVFELSVAGVRELKIVVSGRWTADSGTLGIYERHPKICLGDLMLRS